MTTPGRRPGQRAGLDRDAVLAAARQLLSREGAAAVTLRAVARELDVAPNTLYSYVHNRAALLDALTDDLLASVPEPSEVDPLGAVQALMCSTYDVLTAAPALVPVLLSRQGARGPNAVRLGTILDDRLQRAGVHPDEVIEARRVLIVHTMGAAAFAVAPEGTADDRPVPAERARDSFLRSLSWLLTGMAPSAVTRLLPSEAARLT